MELGYPAQVRALTQAVSVSTLPLQPPSKERILGKAIQGSFCRAPSPVIHPGADLSAQTSHRPPLYAEATGAREKAPAAEVLTVG